MHGQKGLNMRLKSIVQKLYEIAPKLGKAASLTTATSVITFSSMLADYLFE